MDRRWSVGSGVKPTYCGRNTALCLFGNHRRKYSPSNQLSRVALETANMFETGIDEEASRAVPYPQRNLLLRFSTALLLGVACPLVMLVLCVVKSRSESTCAHFIPNRTEN